MRLRRLLAPTLAALAATGGAAAAAEGARNSESAHESGVTRRVFVAARCTDHVLKPRKIILACADANLYASSIAWQSYGGSEAVGQALMHINDCSPSCVSGHFHTFRSQIRLRRIVRCSDGRLYYTRARYEGVAGPKRWSVSYIKPPLRCKLVR